VVRGWFDGALDLLMEHVRTLPDQPSWNVHGAVEEAARLVEPVPEEGADALPILRTLVREYAPRSFNTAGPGYLAYVPGGGILPAALADLISDVTNRFVGVYAAAPLLARLEGNALRWLSELMGYPEGARGVFTSGGSTANLLATVCARTRELGEFFQDGTLYASDEAHHSVMKCAAVATRGSTRPCSRPRSARTAPGDSGRRSPWRARARSTPAPWTTSRRSAPCAARRGSGSTWTAPTAGSSG
jgi:aromatic-L-amino-acid decarboxylase